MKTWYNDATVTFLTFRKERTPVSPPQITTIHLHDQVVALLRAWRSESINFRPASDFAIKLNRTLAEIVGVLKRLHNAGLVQCAHDHGITWYRASTQNERMHGQCCCCSESTYGVNDLFCETCAPEFDGRI